MNVGLMRVITQLLRTLFYRIALLQLMQIAGHQSSASVLGQHLLGLRQSRIHVFRCAHRLYFYQYRARLRASQQHISRFIGLRMCFQQLLEISGRHTGLCLLGAQLRKRRPIQRHRFAFGRCGFGGFCRRQCRLLHRRPWR